MIEDEQFELLLTSTDALTMHTNYQRVMQQLKIWKNDYKNIHQENIRIQQNSSLMEKQLSRKSKDLYILSKDIIKITSIVLQSDQSLSDFQLQLKDLQNKVKLKDIQIQSLKQMITSQQKKVNPFQTKFKQVALQLEETREQLQKYKQRSEKLQEQLNSVMKTGKEKDDIFQKFQLSFQIQKGCQQKYQSQITLLREQAQKKNIKIKDLQYQKQRLQQENKTKDEQHLKKTLNLNQEIKILQGEIDRIRIERDECAKQISQVEKIHQYAQKSKDQQKRIIERLQKNTKLLEQRYRDEAEANKQLQQLLNMKQIQLQQVINNHEYTRKQVQQYRKTLTFRPQVCISELKANIEAYFVSLNKKLAEDNTINKKQHQAIIEAQRQYLKQLIRKSAALSK